MGGIVRQRRDGVDRGGRALRAGRSHGVGKERAVVGRQGAEVVAEPPQ